MKQSKKSRIDEVFPGSIVVRRFTFKTVNTRDSYAHFAKVNLHLAMGINVLRDKCAYLQDCFECLSPHKSAV